MHGKISPTMYTGSMVGAGAMAFALMPYCIANARPDENCSVDLNPQLLAAVFGETREAIQAAITFLSSPDPLSRSQDCDGRRLLHLGPGPFRYRVVNLQKYRDDAVSDERREYWRQHKAWERAGKQGEFKFIPPLSTPEFTNDVHKLEPLSTVEVHTTETVASALASAVCLSIPSWEEVKARSQIIGLIEWRARLWFDEMESVGWVDKDKRPIVKWEPMLTTIKTWWESDGRPMTAEAQSKKRYGNHGKASGQDNNGRFDRGKGTSNEGTAIQYRNLGKVAKPGNL